MIKANKEVSESNKKLSNQVETFFGEMKELEESKQIDPKLN
ncbi:hypothetical protein [Marinilactibacillus sp. 15R]|nr:hypothetical protein [Marinilactibacillus sp. 15R]